MIYWELLKMNYPNERFKIANETKKLIIDLNTLLENIPRKDLYNRDRIRDDATKILKYIYHANLIKDKTRRREYQEKIIVNIRLLDFYLERAYILKYISQKQLYIYSRKLEVISKMVYGWVKSG